MSIGHILMSILKPERQIYTQNHIFMFDVCFYWARDAKKLPFLTRLFSYFLLFVIRRSVNHELTVAYWHIGRRLLEAEQMGKERADYGKRLVAELASHLTAEFGAGFSAPNL